MIGRSYNGTLPNAVAATGVEGLTTIVPISAISSWYDYSRMGGIIGSAHYPAFLSGYVTDPDRQAICAPVRDAMSALDGDADGTMNAFWDARNYRPTSTRSKRRCSRRTASRTTTSTRTSSPSGGTGWRPTTSRASSGSAARATSTRS